MTQSKPKVIFVCGPTASGKSSVAIQIAKSFAGEIINADSRQFYKELNIGTAKPNPAEQESITHHLIDCASIAEPWDVGRFVKEARLKISELSQNKILPIVTGGTGMYLRSLRFGLAEIPAVSAQTQKKLEARLKEKSLQELYQDLQACDPKQAQRIEQSDTQRILRALSVYEETGKPLSSFWNNDWESQSVYDDFAFILDWPRDELYQRINERVDLMLQSGLQKEVQDLLQNNQDRALLEKTIGYQEWFKLGFDDPQKVAEEIKKNTRQFAKRQLTWFRKEKSLHWILPNQQQKLIDTIDRFLTEG
ncbi:MAG: tRNA (adenosine(37)-N6)-dimethylallyltransferase MiaA [Deltaproteobacteria bacterium]|nr:tRNA (adenosine(37)-N6)-dimethylallyltransferase MiaA [Deltaproteobacteria bacterium]